jgi:hypothetical protein
VSRHLAFGGPTTARYLETWIVILVVAICGPLLIESTCDPSTAGSGQELKYFTDTILYAGAILEL